MSELAILTPAPLAAVVHRFDRRHGPLAAYLAWYAAGDLVRLRALGSFKPFRHPAQGVVRGLYHLDGAIVLSWYFLFWALCLHYFVRRSARVPVLAWVVVCAATVVMYPAWSGPTLRPLHLGVVYASPCVSWAIIVYGLLRRREIRPTLAHLVLIVFATTDFVAAAFPLVGGDLAQWPLVRLVSLIGLLTIDAAHVVWLSRRRGREARLA